MVNLRHYSLLFCKLEYILFVPPHFIYGIIKYHCSYTSACLYFVSSLRNFAFMLNSFAFVLGQMLSHLPLHIASTFFCCVVLFSSNFHAVSKSLILSQICSHLATQRSGLVISHVIKIIQHLISRNAFILINNASMNQKLVTLLWHWLVIVLLN